MNYQAIYSICVASLLVACLYPYQALSNPTAGEYAVVINLAGKQRMLTQKMSKEALLVALDVDKKRNLEHLANTVDLFGRTLVGLRSGDSDLGLPPTTEQRIIRQLERVDAIWYRFYPVMQSIISSGQASQDDIAYIAANNLPLLKQMNKVVGAYEKDAAKDGLSQDPGLAITLNLSGKQRMLSQKMSKEFLLIAYQHQVSETKLSLLETYTLFDRTLAGLLNGDDILQLQKTENGEVRAQLAKVDAIWQSFKGLIENAMYAQTEVPQGESISQLAQANLPLLKEMNKAVGLYVTHGI